MPTGRVKNNYSRKGLHTIKWMNINTSNQILPWPKFKIIVLGIFFIKYLRVPNKLDSPPICPTPPPNNCINCVWDILFSNDCKSWSGLVEDWTAVDGLFNNSLILLQLSASLSALGSWKQNSHNKESYVCEYSLPVARQRIF